VGAALAAKLFCQASSWASPLPQCQFAAVPDRPPFTE